MAKINVLPKNVAELIAAGEVVERPMSVVKELIENSIDAGADNIAVEIKNGGILYIRITDNGCGIEKEDVRTAFISHATSKIKSANDLDSVFTLGFRGEALPSVAAVSRVTVLTRTESEDAGTSFVIEGGEEISLEDAGCPVGTTVIVRDLFYNTPARMKFLKRDITEGTYVTDAVTKAALAHPEIKFSLIKDSKKIFTTPGSGDLYSTVYALFGKNVAEALIKCDYEDTNLKIHGFISKPLSNRPNRNMQFFFVNGRNVRIPAAVPALDEAYKNSIMVGKFPMCFLSVSLPADKTDVNVHPAKTEIRFSEETKLFEAVFFAAKSALSRGDTGRPSVTLKEKRDVTQKFVAPASQLSFDNIKKATWGEKNTEISSKPEVLTKSNAFEEKFASEKPAISDKPKTSPFYADLPREKASVFRDRSADIFSDKKIPENEKSAVSTVAFAYEEPKKEIKTEVNVPEAKKQPEVEEKVQTFEKDIRIVGEVFKTYIIVESGDRLLIIDKHAAHERMIFNRLTENIKSNGSQLLLSPVTVTLSQKEYAAVIENLNVFSDAGFNVEDFGSGTVIVRECPVELTNSDISLLIEEIAGKLLKGSMKPVPEKLDWIYHSMSCRAAVKAGDELKPEETESFVKKLLADDSIKYCPHGRPVMYELSKHELEKQFGRLG